MIVNLGFSIFFCAFVLNLCLVSEKTAGRKRTQIVKFALMCFFLFVFLAFCVVQWNQIIRIR